MPHWALAAAALGLVLFGLRRLMEMHVPPRPFLDVLVKLTTLKNFDRARKLCRATPARGMARVAAEALALRLDAREPRHDEVGYRDAPETIPFEERVQRALLPIAGAEREGARRSLTFALAGAALAFSTLALRRFAIDVFGVLSAATLLGAAYAIHVFRDILRGLDLALTELPLHVLPGDAMHVETVAAPAPLTGDGLVLSIALPEGGASEVRLGERVIKIGRSPTATITLAHPDVLRMHAVIDRGRGDATLIDLNSVSQTTVNGAPAARHALAVGDVIGVGPFRIEVRHIGPPSPSS